MTPPPFISFIKKQEKWSVVPSLREQGPAPVDKGLSAAKAPGAFLAPWLQSWLQWPLSGSKPGLQSCLLYGTLSVDFQYNM